MKVSPEERPKVIALAVGIVMVLCLFGFTVVPRLLPRGPQGQLLIGSSATVAAAPAPAPTITPVRAVGIPARTALPPAAAPVPIPPAPAASTDPFWRPLALSLQPPKSNFSPTKNGGLPTIAQSAPGARTAAGGTFPGGSSKIGLAPIPPPSLPEVSLQGIVQDGTAVAVLQVGGQARFLKAGEKLGGDWVLTSIQTASIVLRQGKREVVLNLGQTLQKETPPVPVEVHGVATTTLPPFHNVTLQP